MNAAAKVGAFFVIALILAGLLVWRIEDLRLGRGKQQRISVAFKDVAGLDAKSTVRVAGVRVGKVAKIRIDRATGRAIVDMDIGGDVDLRQGASASVANLGLLGEKYVELVPGPVGAPPLPEGAILQGDVPVTFDQITRLARDIEVDIKGISSNLNQSLGGPQGEERLRNIVENVRVITDDLRVMVASNRTNVDSTLSNFKEFSGVLVQLVDRLDQLVAANQANVTQGIANIREISQKLETTADNLNDITGRIREGKGTVGKLIESDETHKNLNDALVAVKEGVGTLNKTLGTVSKIKLDLGLDSEFLTRFNKAKGYMTLDINPAESPRFYRLEVASQPFGQRTQDVTTYQVTFPDGHIENYIVDKQEYKYNLAFSAEFGWRWKDFALRAGLIEGTGGFGIDYAILKNRLRFSGQVWDFNRPDLTAHAKVSTRYYFSPSVFAAAGWDDFLNHSKAADSVFVGAGVRWTDDDLKYLFGSIPIRP
ncbi:MAG TPA: MlaD family protein [Thermoanaerobaculia bacterium]|nr:MlaD family protein [Thermoanaerobaculia bacterium]